MKNCTLLNGKNLAFVMFFLFFALGGVAQTGKTSTSETTQVIARHYPDPNVSGCPYVKIYWGTDLDEDTFDFETGKIPSYWDNDKTYPWAICDTMHYSGSYCIKSGNGGVDGSTSSISATVDYVQAGTVSFWGGCWGEGTGSNLWDKCEFYIDGERKISLGEVQSWNSYSFDVTAGTHIFTWSYTKDGSVNPTGDGFFVDDVQFDGVGNSKAQQTFYNVYRTHCSQAGGTTADDRVLIAEDVMVTNAIDSTWINLTDGEYQYVVKQLYTTTVQEWSSNCITKTPLAEFTVAVTPKPTAGGTVTGAGTYIFGDSCTLKATPNRYYYFDGWAQDTVTISYSNPYSFVVSRNTNLAANFRPEGYYYYAYAEPYQYGEAEVIGGDGWNINYGDTITLKATPYQGYHFVRWTATGNESRNTVEITTNPTHTFVLDADLLDSLFVDMLYGGNMISFDAYFDDAVSYPITAIAQPEIGGSVSGSGTYAFGDSCTLVATPEYGYHFLNWTYNDDEVSDNPTYQFIVTDTALYIANFERNNYLVTATAQPEDGGTVTGAGTYAYGDTCTLVATANEGYTFLAWMLYGDEYDSTPTIRFEVVDTMAYEAVFELNSYDIAASANPAVGGTVTGAGTYDHFDEITLTATEDEGYTFVNWTENGQEVSVSPTYTFTVTGPRTLVANFSLNSYEISAVAVPEIGGTVTGAGTYNHFETCTLVATPEYGYHFLNWTYNDDEVSTDATYQFTVIDSGLYVANFEINSYPVTATAVPEEGGAITGAGSYEHGSTCTLTATPNTGYNFLNWTLYGDEIDTIPTIQVEVVDTLVFAANFELISYNITAMVTVNPTEGGTVTGAGTYSYGQTCTLTAVPATGYHFVNWTKNGQEVSTDLTYTFEVTEAAEYAANFELNSYDIAASASPAVGGTVTGAGTYDHFDEITLTATEDEGYTFVNWTENGQEVSVSPTYTFTVTGPRTLVANFSLNSYDITASANPAVGGTVTGAGTYNHFETCTLVATPEYGYHFLNWTYNDDEVSTDATYQFTVIDSGLYVANFEINSYPVTATAVPEEGGTITGAGSYEHGSTCTLTATPNTGYNFLNWTLYGDEIDTIPTIQVEVVDTLVFAANFELISYNITAMVTVNPTEGGTVTGAGTYSYGQTCTLTAVPATGYHFVNWTKNGQEVSTDLTYTFEVTEAAEYAANFEINSYDIAASANPAVGGTVTGAGTYNHFEEITLTATEGEGYTFVNWTENGQEVATTLAYTFTVTGPRTLVANFSLNNYEITVSATPTIGGEVSGAGTYDHFATCTLTATPAEGYHFDKWTLNGTEVSTSATYSFTVTGEAAYVAHFQKNRYAITVNHTAGGTVTGAGNYYHFAICTLRAIPSTGYHFVNWTENGQEVATTTTYSFTVTEARTLMANFEQNTYTITATANPTAGGTITGAGDYTHGETCTLTATSNPGYYFVNWTKGNDIVSTEEVYSFEVTESATYRAHFEQYDYVVSADANPEDGGTITGTGEQFHYGQTAQLVAHANTGYHFVNWTLNGVEVSTSNIYTITVTESVHYVANFELDTFEIMAVADPEEGGVITGAGTYTYGQEVILTAEPSLDFQFVNWTEGDEVVSEDNRIVFTADGDRQLVAHFMSTVGLIEHYSLEVSVYPNPATSQLTIEASEPVKMLEIYTINGALVDKQVNCSDKMVIDVENYVSGTYMIRITTDKTVGIRKFVKE